MTLTNTERIMLIASLQTLKAQLLGLKAQGLLPEDDGRDPYLPDIGSCNLAIESLVRGFAVYYSPAIRGAVGAVRLEEEEIPREEGHLTLYALDMFVELERYRAAHPEDMAAKDPLLDFAGFSTREGAHAELAEFAARDGSFPELAGREFRTRAPRLERYRRMVARWNESESRNNLAPADVAGILQAAKAAEPPAHREPREHREAARAA